MKRYRCFSLLFAFFFLEFAAAQEASRTIVLPKPDTVGGKPLMQALKARKSSRSFSDAKIPQQVLSNLLWAAFGVNRPDGRRTAPSARNWQEIDVYAFTPDGVFLYMPAEHALKPLLAEDLRAKCGSQSFVATAPLNLVYIADMGKVGGRSGDDAWLFIGADCGTIAQNVYLYCASEGLGTVVRGMVDREGLAKALQLGSEQKIILAQTVGYPK